MTSHLRFNDGSVTGKIAFRPEQDAPVSHCSKFLSAVQNVAELLQGYDDEIEQMVAFLGNNRCNGGRVFVLGLGGSAANASHFVNDLRKLCGIEAYAPTDNVAELTARGNDDGWDSIFANWLARSNLCELDIVFVLSVGGGRYNVSQCLVEAVRLAMRRDAFVMGIVGRDDGFTARYGHSVIVVPNVNEEWVTPMTEAFQAVIWHCIVNHPELRM